MTRIINFFKKSFGKKNQQQKKIEKILGFPPKNIKLYQEALTHKSVRGRTIHNERLEFLGDAIFGFVIARHLFVSFPKANEGELTQTRAKIVNRMTLNRLAIKININSILKHQTNSNQSIYGNALEALIGAIYIDKGYDFVSKYIEKLIKSHLDINQLTHEVYSYKGTLLEWGQAQKKQVVFELVSSRGKDHEKTYEVTAIIDQQKHESAIGTSIKRAEELAAKKSVKRNNQNIKIN